MKVRGGEFSTGIDTSFISSIASHFRAPKNPSNPGKARPARSLLTIHYSLLTKLFRIRTSERVRPHLP